MRREQSVRASYPSVLRLFSLCSPSVIALFSLCYRWSFKSKNTHKH